MGTKKISVRAVVGLKRRDVLNRLTDRTRPLRVKWEFDSPFDFATRCANTYVVSLLFAPVVIMAARRFGKAQDKDRNLVGAPNETNG